MPDHAVALDRSRNAVDRLVTRITAALARAGVPVPPPAGVR